MSPTVHARRRRVQPRALDATVVLARGGVEVAGWPLAGSRHPDLAVVDDLARLVLAARRLGCSVRLQDAGGELSELLDLVGLTEVLSGPGELGVEPGREAEGGEEAGVEEVVVPHDPVA